MGFFEKLKNGLSKTKTSFDEKINGVFSGFRKVDEELLEELEEILIMSDVGTETSLKIINNLRQAIEIASKNVGVKDYKTVLQEKLQVHGTVNIKYELIEEKGPDHDKIFIAEVSCDGKKLAKGKGGTKKAAEMEAAKIALENLKKDVKI